MRIPTAVLVMVAACEPAVPGGRSSLKVTVKGSDAGIGPGVVFLRFDPRDPGSRPWAIDTAGGLPAERTFWPAVEGEVVVVAAGFDCPSGCGGVDPWLDPPTSTGRAAVSLRRGRKASVTVVLHGSTCGNGVLEPGEACDGGPLCTRCGMDVVTMEEVSGRSGDGIAVLAGERGFVVAWIDGSCGAAPTSCLSWIRGEGGPDPSVVESRSLDLGDTTGHLAGDHASRLAWLTAGGSSTLSVLDPWSDEPAIDLGSADAGLLSQAAASVPAGGSTLFGMAVDPETSLLELRWTAGAGMDVLTTRASAVPSGTLLSSPTLVTVATAGEPTVAATWAALEPGASSPSWFVRRWSCAAHPSGCAPVPLETDAIPIEFDHEPLTRIVLLAASGPEPLAALSVLGDDLELRLFGEDDAPADHADQSAGGFAAAGAVLADAASGPEDGLAALVTAPVAGAPACATRIVSFDPSGAFPPSMISSFGADGDLGCVAAMAILPVHRYVAAWRTPGSTPGTISVGWVVGTLARPF